MALLENGGYRHLSSNKMMKTVADMKGLKMRVMTHPIYIEFVSSLDMSPTPTPWPDLYTALQTGVVDGQENSLGTFRSIKLEDVPDF